MKKILLLSAFLIVNAMMLSCSADDMPPGTDLNVSAGDPIGGQGGTIIPPPPPPPKPGTGG